MKFSIFNSEIIVGGKHTLLYNSFSGTFVVVKNMIVSIKDMTIDKLNKTYPNLYSQLLNGGYIIDEYIDEIERVRERIKKTDFNHHSYILHINPTLDCNFRCWYCYESHVNNSKMSHETLGSVLKLIRSILSQTSITSFELCFFGGEPLFYFNQLAKKIISYTREFCSLSNKTLHVHFTSNGMLLDDKIINFLCNVSCGFQITLDGGKKSHDLTRINKDRKGSFDTIIVNIHKLIKSKINVIVRINYTVQNIDGVISVLEYFKTCTVEEKKYLKFDFQRVWQDRNEGMDETEIKMKKIREIFRKEGFIVLANYIPHDVRQSCYGDKYNHVLINYNGDLFGCTARDFTTSNRIGYINADGELIYDENIVSQRHNSKLSKSVCKSCRIAPICGGGCKQRALEALDSDQCTFNYSEEDKDKMIMDLFEYCFNKKPVN